MLVGVDLGGTNIRAAVATGEAKHAAPARRPTPAHDGPAAVLDAVADCVREATAGKQPDGVAIGIPGPLDPRAGVVHNAPNMSGWHEVPAAAMLSQRVGCPVVIVHDAAAAGFAEWKVGAGQGTRDFIFITASTGVGGALFLNGELYEGSTGSAGEVGHSPVDPDGPACSQGHPGCLEGTASGTAIAAAARRALSAGVPTTLRRMDPEAIDGLAVELAARDGDQLAKGLFADSGRALGRAIGGLINLLAPEVIAVGGGLINAGDLLFAPLRAGVPEIAFEYPASRCRIVEAALGTDAGLIGAVAWAVKTFQR